MNNITDIPQQAVGTVADAVQTIDDTVLGSLVILLGAALAYVLYRWIKYLVQRVKHLESEKGGEQ